MKVRSVTCKLCNITGTVIIEVRGSTHIRIIEDKILHKVNCPQGKNVPKHFRKKNWVRQEREANALVGAQETIASGSINEDGDGRTFHEWRVESKQTAKDYFLLRDSVWEKLCKGALRAGEEPLLHMEIGGKKMCVVRCVLCDEQEVEQQTDRNKKSVRISSSDLYRFPLRLPLSPPAIILTQQQFKEWHDVRFDKETLGQ